MLTFYSDDDILILSDGKFVTDTLHNTPSNYSKLLAQYFNRKVSPINHLLPGNSYTKATLNPDNTIKVTKITNSVTAYTLTPLFKLSPFATSLDLVKKLHPELYI